MQISEKNSTTNCFWDILDDFGKIDFFEILVVKIILKMYKKSKFSKKTLCTKSVILTPKMPISNFLMPKNENWAKNGPRNLFWDILDDFGKIDIFAPPDWSKMG